MFPQHFYSVTCPCRGWYLFALVCAPQLIQLDDQYVPYHIPDHLLTQHVAREECAVRECSLVDHGQSDAHEAKDREVHGAAEFDRLVYVHMGC